MRAVVRLENFDDAYLIIGRFVDPKVLGYVERTQSVVSEYQQLETGRSGIQIASALLFIVVALLLLFAAVWTGLNFANQLVTPVSRLITAANRVRGGDFLARVPEEGSDADELAALGRAFNRMTAQLASQRRELIETNHELDERRRFTETVLAGVTAGVIGLDLEHRIVLPNRSAVRLLDGEAADAGQRGEIAGRPIDDVLPGVEALFERLRGRPDQPVEEELRVLRGGTRAHPPRPPRPAARGRADARLRPDLRRRHGAHQRPAPGRLGRGGAAHRARGQEPAHPDPPLGRAPVAQVRRQPRRGAAEPFQKIVDTIIRQVDDHRPPDRRVLGLRPHARRRPQAGAAPSC